MMRALLSMTLVVVMGVAAWAVEGGVKDSTGLVWSKSQKLETGSWWDWPFASTNSANYSILDVDAAGNPTLYDDWRLPTAHELQVAILDGTMTGLMPIVSTTTADGVIQYAPLYIKVGIWTSETRGNKAWTVNVVRDSAYPYTLIISSSGTKTLVDKSTSIEVFFVRGKAPVK